MITVQNLTKSYGINRALKGVSFQINKGEIVGLLGPNGAGKSTTMKIITGYIPADGGTATVAGHDVVTESLQVRRHIGYMPESTPLYTEMQMVDFLKFVAGVRGLKGARKRARIAEVIDRTGLNSVAGKSIGQLSKGYRQRVGLAQAMIHEPDILILDEPTSGLDPNQITEIRKLIREIGREKTVVLSTHILPEVTATCDRAIIVADGRVVASGTPQELMEQGRGGQITVSVRGAASQAEAEKVLGGVAGIANIRAAAAAASLPGAPLRLVLHPAANSAENLAESVFDAVVSKGWKLTELRQDGASMEDVFAELTRQG